MLKVAKELFFINHTNELKGFKQFFYPFIQMLIKLKNVLKRIKMLLSFSWVSTRTKYDAMSIQPKLRKVKVQNNLLLFELHTLALAHTRTYARTMTTTTLMTIFFSLSYPLKNEAVLTTASFIGFNRHTGRLNELISSVL